MVDRFLQSGENELVAADGAEKGLLFDLGDEVGSSTNDARLRAAEKFVAGEDDEVDAAAKAFLRGGFVLDGGEFVGIHHGPGTEVFDEGEAVIVGEFGDFGNLGFADEAIDVEIGPVDLQNESSLRSDGFFVVVEVGFVGGTDFDEFGAGCFKDVRNPKSSADLDEFGAGNNDFVFSFFNKGAEGEDEGGSAVVDSGGGFGFEKAGESGFEVAGALAAAPGREVKFKVGVAGGDFLKGPGCAGTEGRASEVGVNEDAGGIDDRLEAGIGKFAEALAGGFLDVFARMVFAGEEELAEAVDLAADEEVHQRSGKGDLGRKGGGEFFDGREGCKLAHVVGRSMEPDHSRVKPECVLTDPADTAVFEDDFTFLEESAGGFFEDLFADAEFEVDGIGRRLVIDVPEASA